MNLDKETLVDILSVLGKSRIVVASSIITVNILLLLTIFLYLYPAHSSAKIKLSTVEAESRKLSSDISKMSDETDGILAQKDNFEKLENSGFFLDQDRKNAENVLLQIREDSGVISAKASIEQGDVIKDTRAKTAGRVVLESDVSVRIEAMDDVYIYRYIELAKERMSGDISIVKISAQRTSDINADTLRAIQMGENPVLIEADVQLVWHTMIKIGSTENSGGAK